MIALWKRSRPITLDDPAGQYLHARLGLTSSRTACGSQPTSDTATMGQEPSWHPVMVAKVDPVGCRQPPMESGRPSPHLSRQVRRQGGCHFAAQDDGHHADWRGGSLVPPRT